MGGLEPELVDPKWRSTIRVGAAALVLVGVTYGVNLWLTVGGAPGNASDAQTYLQSVSQHWELNAALWISYMVGDLLLVAAVAGLALLFVRRARPWVVAAVGILALYLAFDLGVTEPNWLALTNMAHLYSTASPAQQTVYVAAAQYGLALAPVLNAMSFIVSVTGFLCLIVAMWGSPVRRGTLTFGAAVMIDGYLAGASFLVPALGVTVLVCLGGFAFWCIVLGAQLLRITHRREDAPSDPTPHLLAAARQ